MTVYAYDGSLEGLLCAFDAARAVGDADVTFQSEAGDHALSLFPPEQIETSVEQARAFWKKLRSVGGKDMSRHVLNTFLSEIPGFEDPLYRVVCLTFDQQRNLSGWHSHPDVRTVLKYSRKVGFEAHRLTGLLRFQELRDGTLYGPCEPDHNVIILLARHFKQRLRAERWVIHDRKRQIGVAWEGRELYQVLEFPDSTDGLLSRDEIFYQDLWRTFTSAVAIESRKNPRLQHQFMPRRYWKYLTEMQSSSKVKPHRP
jgi:probable DNA metabolism protein